MTSIARRLTRAAIHKRGGKPETKPQVTIVTDTGYMTLRPTKGWFSMSNRRVAAQTVVAAILDRVPYIGKTIRDANGVKLTKNASPAYRKDVVLAPVKPKRSRAKKAAA